jgi:hypothetical protein
MNTTITAEQAKNASREKKKPFCKVCFDAGKSEQLYTSHYLKSSPGPDGKVICQTLLNQVCLTCGQNGHTSSYCHEPSVNKKMAKKWHDQQRKTHRLPTLLLPANVEKEIQMRKKADGGIQVKNSFSCLAQDSEEEEKEEVSAAPKAGPSTTGIQTMADRLKAKIQAQQDQMQQAKEPLTLKLPEFPPKSQFWWQDKHE